MKQEFLLTNDQLKELEQLLDWKMKKSSFFHEAFLHPSCSYLQPKKKHRNYQRLEFLGDRILGLIMAEHLLKENPLESEGQIARRFTALVCKDVLAGISKELDLGRFLLIVPSNEENLRKSISTLADILESLIAALYLDAGLEKTRAFIEKQWEKYIKGHKSPPTDPKSALQEWLQSKGEALPLYQLVETKGPLHKPVFVVEVSGAGFQTEKGEGSSKKIAEHKAAEAVLKKLTQVKS